MYTDAHAHAALMARTDAPTSQTPAAQLHRAGYQDGERRPRHRQHWLNHTSMRRMSARLRKRAGAPDLNAN